MQTFFPLKLFLLFICKERFYRTSSSYFLFQFSSSPCSRKDSDTENEIEYLYEYDWLNEKALLPLFSADIDLYQKILDRNSDVRSAEKCSILLSMLRSFREHCSARIECVIDKRCFNFPRFKAERVTVFGQLSRFFFKIGSASLMEAVWFIFPPKSCSIFQFCPVTRNSLYAFQR